MKTLKIGLLGLGQVGSGFYSIFEAKHKSLSQKCGAKLNLAQVAVHNLTKKRKVRFQSSLLTKNALSVVKNPEINLVIELIGGIHPAKELILTALRSGKDVITANKALLAEHGQELFREAQKNGRHLLFEASVGGGIPVIKTIREGLVGNEIDSIQAIINGTSNFILSKMTEEHLDFAEALRLARKEGFAEADPTLDIEGIDAAHKLTILASLVFGGWVPFQAIYVSGISSIRSEDIEFADEFGFKIKLLAVAKKTKSGVEAHVRPTLLSDSHVLSRVNGSNNAVLIHGDRVGDLLLCGQGAGSQPTGSAVMSDVVDIARLRASSSENPDCTISSKVLSVRNASSLLSRYYLRFHVVDRPGVLSKISFVLGEYRISISDVIQKERRDGRIVPLILLTHPTPEQSIQDAVKKIDRLAVTQGKAQVLRIEES